MNSTRSGQCRGAFCCLAEPNSPTRAGRRARCHKASITTSSIYRSTDKDIALAEFFREDGEPSVFVANLSIMGAGVNRKKVCSTIIFINFHTNEQGGISFKIDEMWLMGSEGGFVKVWLIGLLKRL